MRLLRIIMAPLDFALFAYAMWQRDRDDRETIRHEALLSPLAREPAPSPCCLMCGADIVRRADGELMCGGTCGRVVGPVALRANVVRGPWGAS